MRQHASICRAMLLKPSLIRMDELFGALDVITRVSSIVGEFIGGNDGIGHLIRLASSTSTLR